MKNILSYRDLEVWQFGMDLVVEVYRATEGFPSSERFGLVSQMRRASVSIPSNIAEGHGRRDGAYLNHVRIAIGSQAELSTEIEAAERLSFLRAERARVLQQRITDIRKMLCGLRGSLERRRVVAVTCFVAAFFTASAWVM